MFGGQAHNRIETNGTNTSVTVGNTSTLVLAAASERLHVELINDATETIYVALGQAAQLGKGIRLNANGGSYTINYTNLFVGEINAISVAGGANLCVMHI